MEYIPRELKETADISGGDRGQFKEFLVLALWAAGVVIAIYFAVTWTVEWVVVNIPVETERRLFRHFDPALFQDKDHAPDPDAAALAALERASGVLQGLADDPSVPALPYRLFLIDEEKPNALAFPGGSIGLTRGLLAVLEEEISLAFVLGHELGHFKQRDHLRGLGRTLGFALLYGMIFGDVVGADMLAGNAMTLMERHYSRAQEASADAFGVTLVVSRYGRAQGSDRLFQVILAQDKTPAWAYMLTTHPDPKARIAELKRLVEAAGR